MADTYQQTEILIQDAIDAINKRDKSSVRAIAREFRVPYGRLRSRLNSNPSKSDVRGLHNRALKPDQEQALLSYFQRLDEMGIPARYSTIQRKAEAVLAQDLPPTYPRPNLSQKWAKRWLDRQYDLFKVKQKPLAAAQKNAHDVELLQGHFMRFKELKDKYYIFDEDIWNFDETGFRIGMARSDFILSVDPVRRIYSSDLENRESLSS